MPHIRLQYLTLPLTNCSLFLHHFLSSHLWITIAIAELSDSDRKPIQTLWDILERAVSLPGYRSTAELRTVFMFILDHVVRMWQKNLNLRSAYFMHQTDLEQLYSLKLNMQLETSRKCNMWPLRQIAYNLSKINLLFSITVSLPNRGQPGLPLEQ